MNGIVRFIALTIFPSAACAAGTLWLANRLLRGAAKRGSAAAAFAAGFWLGYVFLARQEGGFDLAQAQPWQWIPYFTILAAAVASTIATDKLPVAVSRMLVLVVSIASAWLYVPNWPDLQPPRSVLIPVLAAYFYLLTALLLPLSDRLGTAVLATHLALAAAGSAALIAALVSVTYGQPAIIAAAALAGCAIIARGAADRTIARGLPLIYAVNVGGWAFTGAIYPRPALAALLLAPLAPLAVWGLVVARSSRVRGLSAIALQAASVLAVLALAAGLAILTTGSDEAAKW